MAFLGSLDIIGSGLTAEKFRMDIISQNITNAKTTVTENGEPYRRKQVVFEERKMSFAQQLSAASEQIATGGGVQASEIVDNTRDFQRVYDPTNPQANEDGYVLLPNVDTSEEMVDLMAASNAYQTNLTVLSVTKAMINKALAMGNM